MAFLCLNWSVSRNWFHVCKDSLAVGRKLVAYYSISGGGSIKNPEHRAH